MHSTRHVPLTDLEVMDSKQHRGAQAPRFFLFEVTLNQAEQSLRPSLSHIRSSL